MKRIKEVTAIVAKWPKWKREYCLTQEQAERRKRRAAKWAGRV